MWPSGTSVGSFLSHSTLPRDLIPSLHLAKDIGHVPKSNMTLCWSGNRKGTAVKAWHFQWNGQIERGNFYNRVRLKTRTPKPNPNWKTRSENPNWKPNLNALTAKDSTSRFRLKLMNYPGVQLICTDYWQSMSTWHRTACEKCRDSTMIATPSDGRYISLHVCRCTVSQYEW